MRDPTPCARLSILCSLFRRRFYQLLGLGYNRGLHLLLGLSLGGLGIIGY
jgi:hypothetical protein